MTESTYKGLVMTKVSKVALVVFLLAMPFGLSADDTPSNTMMGTGYGMMGYGGGGRGGMMGYGPGGMMGQPCDECGTYHQSGYNSGAYRAISEKEAREKFDSFVAKHFKGYSIAEMNKQTMPMGTMYWVLIKDKNGNSMELHMNPWGYIMGPFVR